LPEFLPYFLQSDAFHQRALDISVGSLSPTINWKTLAVQEFALPPIAEQEKIGEMLSTIRLKMSSINRLHTAIEQVQEALVNKFLITSSKGIETSLGDFADVNPGASHRSAVEGFIPMDAVPIGGRYPTYVEPVNGRSGARAMAGDVLLARITPCLENGKVCQVPEQYKMIGGSTELLSIRTKGEIHQDLLYHWARSKRIRRLAEEKMSGTTGRLRLGGKELASLPLRVKFGTDLSQLLKRLEALESLKVAQQDSALSLSVVYRASLNSALAGGQ
jgi:type I restriction enzyme S subunit